MVVHDTLVRAHKVVFNAKSLALSLFNRLKKVRILLFRPKNDRMIEQYGLNQTSTLKSDGSRDALGKAK